MRTVLASLAVTAARWLSTAHAAFNVPAKAKGPFAGGIRMGPL
jgi:hypothetical protein